MIFCDKMSELSQLVKQRGQLKAKLTTFENFITSLENDPGRQIELLSRIEKVEAL